MTGSTLAVLLIPPAGTIFLLAWLALVFHAGRDRPHRPDATRRRAAPALARPRRLPSARPAVIIHRRSPYPACRESIDDMIIGGGPDRARHTAR